MSASLIHQLAKRLGCTPEAAEVALRQYVARLQQQLEQEGQATLPGLGHLTRSEEGLHFEPDASLAQAVNHRFAGLEPVVVEPPSPQAYRKTEVVPPEGEAAEEAAPSPFYEVEPEAPPAEAPPYEADEAASAAVEETPAALAPEPEPEAASTEPTPPPSPEPSLRPPRPPRFHVEEERRRGLPVWVPAALLIVVLGAVAVWFLLFSRPSEPELAPPASPQAEVQTTTPPETTAAAATPTADTAAATSASTAEASPTASGGYALIVGSTTSQTAAERIAERFRRAPATQGLSVTIVTTTTDGTTRYRVAVGRYNSPEEALAAKRQLGNVLPPDAWVLRIPSTTQ